MSHSAIAAYSSHELCDGDAGLGRAAFGRFVEQPTELDVRLLLGLDGGLEPDRAPGERIGPGVHGDPERPARQLLYVTFAILGAAERARTTDLPITRGMLTSFVLLAALIARATALTALAALGYPVARSTNWSTPRSPCARLSFYCA